MTTVDLICQKLRNLPQTKQAAVLEYVESLDRETSDEEPRDNEWFRFSLECAVRGMESEEFAEYSLADLKERFE